MYLLIRKSDHTVINYNDTGYYHISPDEVVCSSTEIQYNGCYIVMIPDSEVPSEFFDTFRDYKYIGGNLVKKSLDSVAITILPDDWAFNEGEYTYLILSEELDQLPGFNYDYLKNYIADVVLTGNRESDLKSLKNWSCISFIDTWIAGFAVICYEKPPSDAITIRIKEVR